MIEYTKTFVTAAVIIPFVAVACLGFNAACQRDQDSVNENQVRINACIKSPIKFGNRVVITKGFYAGSEGMAVDKNAYSVFVKLDNDNAVELGFDCAHVDLR